MYLAGPDPFFADVGAIGHGLLHTCKRGSGKYSPNLGANDGGGTGAGLAAKDGIDAGNGIARRLRTDHHQAQLAVDGIGADGGDIGDTVGHGATIVGDYKEHALEVSILAPSRERALLKTVTINKVNNKFQSSPPLARGRYHGWEIERAFLKCFNPRPLSREGATSVQLPKKSLSIVSILAPSRERALPA